MTCLATLESWQPRKATLGSSRADTVDPALTIVMVMIILILVTIENNDDKDDNFD